MEITFMGAAQTVTGSKYLITVDQKKFLVDCGLFQGYKDLRLRNWNPLPIDPKTIEAVVLTHAHIDHSGYIPLLVKQGFKGKIYCSKGTRDLCEILLPDSGFLQEKEADYANKYGYSKHKPALPLYTVEDAKQSLQHFYPVDFGVRCVLHPELDFTLHHAGHILGAATVMLNNAGKTLLFSGDLGRPHDLVMNPPAQIQRADYLVMESTYGNRIHSSLDLMQQIADVINQTIKRGGSIIVPAFAVGRAQTLLYCIHQLKRSGKIPNIPVFLDSPMATSATKLFCDYSKEHRLSAHQCAEMDQGVRYVRTEEESKEIDGYLVPRVIISASGMATGGRILHHLKVFLPDYRNTILLTGYQAGGTRGERLLRGEQEIKIHGGMISVKAQIKVLNNISAHADAEEILAWLRHFVKPPKTVFITHGESDAALGLKEKIETELGWTCVIPEYLQKEIL